MRRKVFLSLAIVVALVAGGVAGGLLNGVVLGEPGGSIPTPINYQGTLLNQSTGSPVPNGQYSIVFSVYSTSTGGSPLWQETQTVDVEDGLFSVLLGAVVALDASIFDGSPRYLGIEVEGDGEMTPRQLLASVPYAFHAEDADTLDGMEGADLEESAEIDADIAAHALSPAAHHARYTDLEAWAAVLSSDGAGSGLDADTVDGLHASALEESAEIDADIAAHALSPAAHHARYTNSEAWAAVLANDGSGSGLDADMLDGMSSANFATAAHTHDNRYYTESESNTRYVNVGGDTMTGTLYVDTSSSYGVYGEGNNYGVKGVGFYGVSGYSGDYTGVYGQSDGYAGVWGASSDTGVRGGGATWDFYAGGMGTNYGPFTGAHEVKLSADFPQDIQPGMIVSVTGEVQMRMTDGETSYSSTLPTVQLSDTPGDSRVFGALVMEAPLPDDHWYTSESEDDRFGIVNALGEGRVWVTNVNGDIEAGDYITTSAVAGYGQKQDDDLLHSYTLGKAIEDVVWSEVTETVEFDGHTYKAYPIAVVYTSG